MLSTKTKVISRIGFMLLILLSGFAILPFTPISADQLDWRAFAGIYQPTLTVNVANGAPGSAFLFQGAGYPASQLATVFVNGIAVGSLPTNASGEAAFVIQTHPLDALGSYQISLATDANASATVPITLDNGSVVPPPSGFDGPTIALDHTNTFLPIIRRQ